MIESTSSPATRRRHRVSGGRRVRQTGSGRRPTWSVRGLNEDIAYRFTVLAAIRRMTLGDLINEILGDYLERNGLGTDALPGGTAAQ